MNKSTLKTFALMTGAVLAAHAVRTKFPQIRRITG